MDLKWEHKVHQIMMRAQELSPTELERFLEKTCGDDTRLRREVEKRLEGIRIVMENSQRLFDWDDRL